MRNINETDDNNIKVAEVVTDFTDSEPWEESAQEHESEAAALTTASSVPAQFTLSAASMNVSKTAQRFFRSIVSLIKQTDLKGHIYSFKISDYAEFYGIKGVIYDQLEAAARELKKPITVRKWENGKYVSLTFSYINELKIEDGIAKVEIGSSILPFYQGLANSKYRLADTRSFKQYTFALYEYLITKLKKENAVEFIVSVASFPDDFDPLTPEVDDKGKELKDEDGNIIYKKRRFCRKGQFDYSTFKREVLVKGQKIINEGDMDIRFTFEEIKRGHAVDKVKFNVIRQRFAPNEEDVEIVGNPYYDGLDKTGKQIYDYFVKLDIPQNIIEDSMIRYHDKITEIAKYVEKCRRNPKNKRGYLVSIVQNGWTENYFGETIDVYFERTEKETVKDQYSVMDNRDEIVAKLKANGVSAKKSIVKCLTGHTDEYIEAQIEYCIKEFRDKKGAASIAGAIVQACEDDYAKFEQAKQQAQVEEEKKNSYEAAKESFLKMSHEQLKIIRAENEEQERALKEELAKRAEEEKARKEEEFQKAYRDFLRKGSMAEKEECKMRVLNSMPDTFKSITSNNLKETEYSDMELEEIPLDVLIVLASKNGPFVAAFRELIREKLGYK